LPPTKPERRHNTSDRRAANAVNRTERIGGDRRRVAPIAGRIFKALPSQMAALFSLEQPQPKLNQDATLLG
jgi:hypothetical protein